MASGLTTCTDIDDLTDGCQRYSVGGAKTVLYIASYDAVKDTVVLDPITGAVTNITFNAGFQKFSKVQVQLDQTLPTDSLQGGDRQTALNRLHSVVLRISDMSQEAKNLVSKLEQNQRGWVIIVETRFRSKTTGQTAAYLFGHYNGIIVTTNESTLGQAQTDLPGETITLAQAQEGFAPEIVPDETLYPSGIAQFINAMLENPA